MKLSAFSGNLSDRDRVMEANKQNGGQPKFSLPQRGNPHPVTPPARQPSEPRAPHSSIPPAPAPSRIHQLFPTKKMLAVMGASSVVAAVIVIGLFISHTNTPATSASRSAVSSEHPTYPTLSPNGKSVDDLGGWKRVSPPKNDPVFAYTDTIGGISISISQQSLPPSLATDTDSKITELAKAYNATDKINASGTTAYIGTSAKGPQSVILTKKNLLVLIKSQQKIDDAAWVRYIESLR